MIYKIISQIFLLFSPCFGMNLRARFLDFRKGKREQNELFVLRKYCCRAHRKKGDIVCRRIQRVWIYRGNGSVSPSIHALIKRRSVSNL
jgi:hypothetical protein